MTVLHPNTRLGRAIRAGKLKAVPVKPAKGEDIGDAFVRTLYERDPAGMKAFEDRIDAIVDNASKKGR